MRKSLLIFFANLRLTLVLILTIAGLSAIGTFVPQGDDAAKLAEKWDPDLVHVLEQLGVTNAYHSWWFLLVLALLAVNLIACTILRLPRVWKLSQESEGDAHVDPELPATAFNERWECAEGVLPALDVARKMLAKDYPNLRQVDGPRSRMLVGEKHRLSLWGAWVVHAGLMCLFAAGFLRIVYGYSLYMVIKEGERAVVPKERVIWGWSVDRVSAFGMSVPLPRVYHRMRTHNDFQVGLDTFDLQYYPNSSAPKLFRSDVKILDMDNKIQRGASILVNQPLSQGDVMLYQASWGYEGLHGARLDVKLPGDRDRYEVTAPFKKKIKLLKTAWELEITDFYPDATMVGPGKLEQASSQLNNPAIRLKFFERGKERAHFWIVYAFPQIQMSKVAGLEAVGRTVDPVPFTVLQVGHDPGVPLALAGALIVILGVFSSFYLFYRKIWVRITSLDNGRSLIQVAGFSKRNKMAFKRAFGNICRAMRKELGETSQGEQ